MKIKLPSCVAMLLIFGSAASLCAQEKSDKATAHFERASLLAAHKDSQAEREYKLAIHYRGGNFPEAWLELSQFLAARLRFSEAASALQNYLAQADEKDFLAGDFEDLIVLLRAADLREQIDKSEKPPLEDYLEFINTVGRYGGAADALPYAEKAAGQYPESAEASLALARSLPPDQRERRFSVLQKTVELDPKNPAAHAQLGWHYFLHAGRRNTTEAINEFRKSLEFSNDQHIDAWEGLGQALAAEGRRKEAAEAFRNYLRFRKVPSQYDSHIKRQIELLEGQAQSKN